jgi:hypothetical protein
LVDVVSEAKEESCGGASIDRTEFDTTPTEMVQESLNDPLSHLDSSTTKAEEIVSDGQKAENCQLTPTDLLEQAEKLILQDNELLDILVARMIQKLGDDFFQEISENLEKEIQSRKEDEEDQKFLAEREKENTALEEQYNNRFVGCPSFLHDVVSSVFDNGGDCNQLAKWKDCNKTLEFYANLDDDELQLGCDHPTIFENGMTLFCQQNNSVSEYYEIRCYHRKEMKQ